MCVIARQRDLAGNWVDAPADCVVPNIPSGVTGERWGCNTPGAAPVPMALAAGLLFLGVGLRRRS